MLKNEQGKLLCLVCALTPLTLVLQNIYPEAVPAFLFRSTTSKVIELHALFCTLVLMLVVVFAAAFVFLLFVL